MFENILVYRQNDGIQTENQVLNNIEIDKDKEIDLFLGCVNRIDET